MYYQNYEDYMRNILGYPVQVNTLSGNTYNDYMSTEYEYTMQQPRYSKEILDLYPEIYKIVNPMVCKICEVNTKPITRELIEQMTDEIYLNIESDPSVENVVNINVSLPEQERTEKESLRQNTSNKSSKNQSSINQTQTNQVQKNQAQTNQSRITSSNYSRDKQQENKKELTESNTENKKAIQIRNNDENRQIRRRNNTLRDLIKILILNRLLGGNFRPHRPNPPRPPFPGGQRPNMPRYVYKNF